tara:strand:- start:1100 stop:1534 length:435 start_codon:yes stop_codon:yes gene_type:complete
MSFIIKVQRFAKKNPLSLLRIFLGLIFLSAGLQKILFFKVTYENFLLLGIYPAIPFLIITIILEVICGILLVINRYKLFASLVLGLIILITIIVSVINGGYSLLNNINDIYILTLTPTFFATLVIILVGLITISLSSFEESLEK